MSLKGHFTDNGALYQGDCRDVIPDMHPFDLVITSPPYNVGIDYDTHNDTMPSKEYYAFIKEVFTLIYQKLNTSGRCAINILYEVNMRENGGRIFNAAEYWKILQDIGFGFAGIVDLKEKSPHRSKLTSWGSWLSPSAPYIYNPKECVLIVYKDQWKKAIKGTSYFNKENKHEFLEYVFGMWEYQAETKGLTKANFSLDIPLKAIKMLSWEEDIIFDPFMGSGTTALAAELLGRQWKGCELSPSYCDIILNRIKDRDTFNKFFEVKM